ncbi:hypothetical protein B0J11DRAFT_501283 [Dendryphion nanum]|uniref:Uncharacterized protein n=1 Tax=Dendryphion nanum TaxID=256645 RepID=A0A9P9EJ15_9PLEO|nr:hypothetical protein B0J11DRAFT_501283 [Dendryphion nanum]
MLFSLQSLASALLFVSSVSALPLESFPKGRAVVPRAKSYSIVNVDGGSTALPSSTVVEKETKTTTKTKTVTDSGPAPTETKTIIIAPSPAPAPSAVSTSTKPTSKTTAATVTESVSPSSRTPPTSVVTIIVTETAGPTEFYDNGLWHTRYAVKTFEAVAAPSSTTSITTLPVVTPAATPIPSNGTLNAGRR